MLHPLRNFESSPANYQLDRAVVALLQNRSQRSLRVAGETRVELATFDLGVERVAAADAQRLRYQELFGFVRELEHHHVRQKAKGPDGIRRVVDLKVRPVVTVGEDEPSVV